MIKATFLCFCLVSCMQLSAQSISKLDELGGYKEFKIGTHISLLKAKYPQNFKRCVWETHNDHKLYEYCPLKLNDIWTAFGLKVFVLQLTFDENEKLHSIYIELGNHLGKYVTDKTDLVSALNAIKEAFGKPTVSNVFSTYSQYIWKGSKVELELRGAPTEENGAWHIHIDVDKSTKGKVDF